MAYAIAALIVFASVLLDLSHYSSDSFVKILFAIIVIKLIFVVIIHFKKDLTKSFAQSMLVLQLFAWYVVFCITLFFMAQLKVLLLITSIMAFIFSLKHANFRVSIIIILLISVSYYIIAYTGINYFQQPGDLRFEALVLTSFTPVCIFVAYMAEKENRQQTLLQAAFINIEKVTREREIAIKQLEHVAATDELTGLPNRRSMRAMLEHQMQRFLRYKSPFCVLMIDVDHFKLVNDKYGHQSGDDVLVHIAEVMKSTLRTSDILARWGGEEFIVMLPDTSLNDATEIAKRLCNEVEKSYLVISQKKLYFTISAGLTQTVKQSSIDEIIQSADRMLYQAKDYGRNRVEVDELLEE